MHILIVGGTNFVGYHLVWRLLARGDRVTILNRGGRADPFGDRVERLRADRTTPAFARVLAGRTFDAAVDFASFTGDDARGAVKVLQSAVGHYIFISSGQVYLILEEYAPPAREQDYGGTVTPRPREEQHLNQWLYGAGKRDAEDVLIAAWERDRFPATTLRLPMVNGERDGSGRLEAYLWRLLDGGPLLLPSGGDTITRHVYSGAVVRLIASILGREDTWGRAYNLAQDEMPPLRELVEILADSLGAPARIVDVSPEVLTGAGLDPREVSPFSSRWMSCVDPTRARDELGFRHEPLRVYLDRIVAAYLAHFPSNPPDNYATRDRERTLAKTL
jgi:nucleoside-diphosphate-sugar epimerase